LVRENDVVDSRSAGIVELMVQAIPSPKATGLAAAVFVIPGG
jgi:hypothetical protein